MRYSASKKSVFGAFFAGLIVVCAFETPIVHLVLMGRVRTWVQLLVAALNVYMIVWLWLERS